MRAAQLGVEACCEPSWISSWIVREETLAREDTAENRISNSLTRQRISHPCRVADEKQTTREPLLDRPPCRRRVDRYRVAVEVDAVEHGGARREMAVEESPQKGARRPCRETASRVRHTDRRPTGSRKNPEIRIHHVRKAQHQSIGLHTIDGGTDPYAVPGAHRPETSPADTSRPVTTHTPSKATPPVSPAHLHSPAIRLESSDFLLDELATGPNRRLNERLVEIASPYDLDLRVVENDAAAARVLQQETRRSHRRQGV